ncbi:MAG: hypothetical protein ABIA74_03610 [bacterium]
MKTSILSTMVPQYIVDSNGKKTSVVLDLKTFASLVEELEDLYDIAQAEEILAQGEEEEGRSIEEIEDSLNKKN